MGQRYQGADGTIYEELPGGGFAIVDDVPAGPVTVGAPDPGFRYEAPKAQADAARAAADAARAAAEAPYAGQVAQAQAAKAQAEAEKARRDLAAQQATANPQQQRAMAALADDEVLAALARARKGVDAGYSAGRWARLGDIPVLGSQIEPQGVVDLRGDLGTVASRVTLDTLAKLKQASPTGASGLGSLTEREGALLRDSVAALDQAQSPEKLLDSLATVERHYRNVRALMDGQDYRDPKVAERYGIAADPRGRQEQPGALAQGAYREEADPALRGVNERIRSMIGSGRSASEIVGFMNSVRPGLGDEMAGSVAAAVKFRAQNPNVPAADYPVSVEQRQVPMSDARQFVNTAAQMPFGTAAMSFADAASAGNLHRATDNPAVARAGMSALADENWKSALFGTAAGGAAAGGLIEGALPLRAVGALARFRQPAADALYGTAYGASQEDGSALKGAAEGVAGGYLGRLGTRALGGALRGVTNPDAQAMRRAGIGLTPGMALRNEGTWGRKVAAREDRLAGYGGIGEDIADRRRDSFIDFNRAAFREAVPPTAQTVVDNYAEQGVGQLRQAGREAYDAALGGRTFDLTDPQFRAEYDAARAAGGAIPRVGDEFGYYADQRMQPFLDRGQIGGREAQDVLQGFRDADFGTDAMGTAAADAAGQARGAFAGMVERQAPGTMEQLGQADTAYRRLNVLSDAVGRAMNTEGIFSPAQLGMASRANARRFNGPIGAATTDRPFFDLQRAAQNVLPSKVPDSGTAGRIEAGGMLGRARGAVRNAMLSPLYSQGTQAALNTALLDRPEYVREVGDRVLRNSRIGGLFGAPLLVAY